MARTKAKSKTDVKIIRWVFSYVAVIAATLLLVVSVVAFWAHSFIGTMVTNELSAQKIYFPEKGSAALDPATYPDLQQYAGQLVDTPEKAKAYAEGYIGRHLAKVADGKVYAEVSTAAQKDPTNQTLQRQKTTLFQGETLRAMLLTSGYGFGTIGKVAGIAAFIAIIASAACLVCALVLRPKRTA